MAVDYFIKFDGIKGESTDAKHKDEVDVESWSWGETQTAERHPGGGGGVGRVSMQDFQFVMRLNRASPPSMRACATGQHIKSATLTGRKAGGKSHGVLRPPADRRARQPYQTGDPSMLDVPIDQVSLNSPRSRSSTGSAAP